MDPNDRIDLSSVNKTKTKKQLTLPKIKNPFKKNSAGPGRDAEGKFTSGSGGLLGKKKFDFKRAIPVVAVVALVGGFLVFRSFAGTALLGNDGEYVPVTPARLYDTRTVGSKVPVGAGKTITIPVAGKAGVPAGAKAVVAYVSAVGPAANGYTRVGASDQALTATQQNYSKGQSVTNQVTIPVSAAGSIKLMSSQQSHFVIDVHGYISSETGSDGLRYATVQSVRAYDTRKNGSKTPVAAGKTVTFDIASKAGIPPEARAVSISLSAVGPAANGYARMWLGSASSSPITILNYTKGQSITGQVTVPLDASGKLTLFTSAQSHFSFDVVGYYEKEGYIGLEESQQGRFVYGNPVRIMDTRDPKGQSPYKGSKIPKDYPLKADIDDDRIGPAHKDARRYIVSITAVSPSQNGYTRAGATYNTVDTTILNHTKAQSITNQFIMPKNSNTDHVRSQVVVQGTQDSHYVIDVVGYVVDKTNRQYPGRVMLGKSLWQNETTYKKRTIAYTPRSTAQSHNLDIGLGLANEAKELMSSLGRISIHNASPEGYITASGAGERSISVGCTSYPVELKCEPLASGMKKQQYNDPFRLPYKFINNKSYTFTSEITSVQGRSGVWLVTSITVDGKTTPLQRTQLPNDSYGILEQTTIWSDGYFDCQNSKNESWDLANLTFDGKSIENYQRRIGYSSSSFELGLNECPGFSRTDDLSIGAGSGDLKLSFGVAIPRAQRDIEKPKIESSTFTKDQYGRTVLAVRVTDNKLMTYLDASVVVEGKDIGLYSGEAEPEQSNSLLRHFEAGYGTRSGSEDYVYTQFVSGKTYDIKIKAYDTSGNVLTETRSIMMP